MRARIAARLEGAPLFFFAVVIGIAITFRVAIGWAKSASDQPVAEPAYTSAPAAKPATTTKAASTEPDRDSLVDPAGRTTTVAGAATTMPADRITGDPKGGGLPKRKPRTHGRR